MIWFVFGGMGLVFLPLTILFLVGGADWQHKIGGAVVCLFFWALMSGGLYLDSSMKDDAWNGGYCECGSHWELRGASKSRTGNETKYYQCPNCYAEIRQ